MNEHLFKRFDKELNKLRFRLVKMGTLVQQMVETSLKSLLEGNREYAALVLELEEKVDNLDIKIDRQCMRIFALHQPVAMDLRLVLSTVSINDNMELVGDLATNIAEKLRELAVPPGIIARTKFNEMAAVVNEIISKIMDAFVFLNFKTAIDALKLHGEVDELFKANMDIIVGMMKEDTGKIEICSHLIDINRNIQFISRQAKCISEELVFLVKARMIKHQNVDTLDIDFASEGDPGIDAEADFE